MKSRSRFWWIAVALLVDCCRAFGGLLSRFVRVSRWETTIGPSPYPTSTREGRGKTAGGAHRLRPTEQKQPAHPSLVIVDGILVNNDDLEHARWRAQAPPTPADGRRVGVSDCGPQRLLSTIPLHHLLPLSLGRLGGCPGRFQATGGAKPSMRMPAPGHVRPRAEPRAPGGLSVAEQK